MSLRESEPSRLMGRGRPGRDLPGPRDGDKNVATTREYDTNVPRSRGVIRAPMSTVCGRSGVFFRGLDRFDRLMRMVPVLLSRQTVLSRVCAPWLVLLIVLPFSAPFPTCDLASLGAGPGRHTTDQPVRSRVPMAALAVAANTHALPVARATQRHKSVASPLHSLIRCAVTPVARIARGTTGSRLVSTPFSSPLRI
jgi:hypothetical protein